MTRVVARSRLVASIICRCWRMRRAHALSPAAPSASTSAGFGAAISAFGGSFGPLWKSHAWPPWSKVSPFSLQFFFFSRSRLMGTTIHFDTPSAPTLIVS